MNSLSKTEAYINQNHHLPQIQSAAAMAKEGVNLGELNIKLLQKIEELTLYLIERDKELKLQNRRISGQQSQINRMKNNFVSQLNRLKNQNRKLTD